MNMQKYGVFTVLFSIIFSLYFISAYAEVTELGTNKDKFFVGSEIIFQGKVNDGDSGLVTIVIRDKNDNFVMLAQIITNTDYTFEKKISLDDRFDSIGIYNATGFIQNMTEGITTNFSIMDKKSESNSSKVLSKNEFKQELDETTASQIEIEQKPQDKIKKQVDFVDPQKDPSHYIERYYNEPKYKSWFDRNYPEYTIEEAVGYTEQFIYENNTESHSNKQMIPKAEAISISESNHTESIDDELPQFILAIAGLAILFGATYGVKRKADHNSKQISSRNDKKKNNKPDNWLRPIRYPKNKTS